MDLIKIGNFDWPSSRWEDSRSVFERIYLIQRDDIVDHSYDWVELISFSKYGSIKNKVNGLMFLLLEKFINQIFLYNILIFIFRLFNCYTLYKINNLKCEFVYSSYNDYDRSDHLTVVLLPFIKNKILVRAVKETRKNFRYPEIQSLNKSNAIIFNSRFNLEFFNNKYSVDLSKKEIYFDLDEDWRGKNYVSNVRKDEKYSLKSNNKHFVILSGRVFSELGNIRSGARQYYIKLIESIISKGYCIDLYTAEIIPTSKGLNLYHELEVKSRGLFKIKGILDFKNHPSDSYTILSKYDFGILHNYESGQNVSYFDKFNIPNRFYEYLIAGVIPVVKAGDSLVVESLINEKRCGIVYSDFEDFKGLSINDIQPYLPTFEEYCFSLKKIFNKEL